MNAKPSKYHMSVFILPAFLRQRLFLETLNALDCPTLQQMYRTSPYDLLSWFVSWKSNNPVVIEQGMTYERFLAYVLTEPIDWNVAKFEVVDFVVY